MRYVKVTMSAYLEVPAGTDLELVDQARLVAYKGVDKFEEGVGVPVSNLRLETMDEGFDPKEVHPNWHQVGKG